MSRQPQWKRIDNLGDINPIEHGGFFVYVDRTGVYGPEVEWLESPGGSSAGEPEGWTLSRACVEKDPTVEWWFKDLPSVASTIGMDVDELTRMALSEDVLARAMVYQYLMSHFGAHEFDSYPQTFTKRSQLPRRIRRPGQ